MTTKNYLNQVNRLNKRIKNKISESAQLRTLIMSVSSLRIDNDRVQNSGSYDPLGDKIAKLVDIEQETNDLIDQLIDIRELIIAQIDNIENDSEYNVLHLRFISGKALSYISDEMQYSMSQTKRIYGRGLQSFEKKYGHMYLDKK